MLGSTAFMNNPFKLWSETSPQVKHMLKPSLDLRSWGELSEDDKKKVLKFLLARDWFDEADDIVRCILFLNEEYKYNTFGHKLFEHGGIHFEYGYFKSCCREHAQEDFFNILRFQESDVAIQLLSIYASKLINDSKLGENASDEDLEAAFAQFDRFANAINDVFEHFAVNLCLTRQGFVPRQDKLIEAYVIEPTFAKLAGDQWSPVQKELSNALSEYQRTNQKSYSTSITHLVSALQAFLQIKVKGKIGKGDISDLVDEGIRKGILPDDLLSKKVIKGLESTVMEYRKLFGDAHPKKDYAEEKDARFILNIVIVFIQHCID